MRHAPHASAGQVAPRGGTERLPLATASLPPRLLSDPTPMRRSQHTVPLMFLCWPLMSPAQPTLIAGQYALQVGDHFELATFNSGIWPVSGADLTWNYANEAGSPWGDKDVVDPATAPGYAYFPSATSALQWSVGEFFRSDTAGEDHLGYHISSSEYGICSDPRTDMVYPFTYGDSFTDSLHCTENGPSPRTRTGVFTVTCTGYGTLILPLGTFTDCLLLRRTWSYEDDYGTPDLGYSVGETYSIVQASIGHPLLSYTTSTYTQGGGSIDNAGGFRLDDLSTGLSSTMYDASHITVRPNPATDEVTVTLSGNGRATFSVLAGDAAWCCAAARAWGLVSTSFRWDTFPRAPICCASKKKAPSPR